MWLIVKFSLRTALCRGLLNGHFGPNVRLDDNTIKGRLTMVLMRLARTRARCVTDRENFLVPGLLTEHKLLSKCHDFLQQPQNHRQWKRTILWSSPQFTNQSKGMMAWPSYLEASYATHQRPSPWKEKSSKHHEDRANQFVSTQFFTGKCYPKHQGNWWIACSECRYRPGISICHGAGIKHRCNSSASTTEPRGEQCPFGSCPNTSCWWIIGRWFHH